MVNSDQSKSSVVLPPFLFPVEAVGVGLVLASVWGGKAYCVFSEIFLILQERLKEETNSSFLPLDVILSGYDAWNCSCHLLTIRNSGLRAKSTSKDGRCRAGRQK